MGPEVPLGAGDVTHTILAAESGSCCWLWAQPGTASGQWRSPCRGAVERGVRPAGPASHTHGVLHISEVPAQVRTEDGQSQATFWGARQGLHLQHGEKAVGSSSTSLAQPGSRAVGGQ